MCVSHFSLFIACLLQTLTFGLAIVSVGSTADKYEVETVFKAKWEGLCKRAGVPSTPVEEALHSLAQSGHRAEAEGLLREHLKNNGSMTEQVRRGGA